MIEITDKINNTKEKVKALEIAIHPLTNQMLFLEDFEMPGKFIYGIIFDEKGTLFCYKNVKRLK